MLALSASAHVALTVAFGFGDEDGIAPLSSWDHNGRFAETTDTDSAAAHPTFWFAASRPLVSTSFDDPQKAGPQ